MFDFRFRFLSYFLHGDQLILVVAFEHDALRTGTDPLEIAYRIERYFERVLFRLPFTDRIPDWHQTTEHVVQPTAFGTRTCIRIGCNQILIIEELR